MPTANNIATVDPSDRTDARIRTFLASMRPVRDEVFRRELDEASHRGRSLVERLALSAEGDDGPRLRLTAHEAADVLSFLRCSEPVDPAGWWNDGDISHVCGYVFVLDALARSLRERPADGEERSEGTPGAAVHTFRTAIWDAPDILRCTAVALDDHFGDWPSNIPNFAQSIRQAADVIDTADTAFGDFAERHL